MCVVPLRPPALASVLALVYRTIAAFLLKSCIPWRSV
jgi:hypothetical protein